MIEKLRSDGDARDIVSAVAAIERRPDLPMQETVLRALETALRVQTNSSEPPSRHRNAAERPDDYFLCLVNSARSWDRKRADQRGRRAPPTGAVKIEYAGWEKYEDLDPGWLGCFVHYLGSEKVKPFPTHSSKGIDPVIPIGDNIRIGIAGDWGTLDSEAKATATQLAKQGPECTIHLGDVYYSGDEDEEPEFVNEWPSGIASNRTFALNSNHEMYTGGVNYFGLALGHRKFGAQRGVSYFALSNSNWLVIGLDSAYFGEGFMYLDGHLGDDGDVQATWLRSVSVQARTESKRIIVLTHHPGLNLDLTQTSLWAQLARLMGGGPDFWYWGHVHAAAVFKPVQSMNVSVQGRCVGHGAFPEYPVDETTAKQLTWAETRVAADSKYPQRGLHGFAILNLSGPNLEETFFDEYGRKAWP